MSEKDINRWHNAITPRETGKPWVLGSGGSWDLKEVQPIPDEMLAELAQRYHYAGTPWNCHSMPLTPSDREYMFLIYSSMQGLVARLRIAEKKVAESLAAPAVANGVVEPDILPDEFWELVTDCGGTKDLGKSARLLQAWVKNYARAAIAASTQQAAHKCSEIKGLSNESASQQAAPKQALTDEQIVVLGRSLQAFKNKEYRDRKGSKLTLPEREEYDAAIAFARAIETAAAPVPNALLVAALKEIIANDPFNTHNSSIIARAALASVPIAPND